MWWCHHACCAPGSKCMMSWPDVFNFMNFASHFYWGKKICSNYILLPGNIRSEMISDSPGASGDCMACQIYDSGCSFSHSIQWSRGPSSKPTAKSRRARRGRSPLTDDSNLWEASGSLATATGSGVRPVLMIFSPIWTSKLLPCRSERDVMRADWECAAARLYRRVSGGRWERNKTTHLRWHLAKPLQYTWMCTCVWEQVPTTSGSNNGASKLSRVVLSGPCLRGDGYSAANVQHFQCKIYIECQCWAFPR